MPDITRLNGVIKALEQGQTAFVAFTPVDIESAVAMASSKLDGVAFEMEHAPLDFPGLRQALQFMLDPRHTGACGHAHGARAAQRRRDEQLDRQAGSGYRRVRHYFPPCELGGRSVDRRRRLPLSALVYRVEL